VLLAFAEPFDLENSGRSRFEMAVRLVETIWNAVVLADVRGDPTSLDLLRSQAEDDPDVGEVLERLVDSKRCDFAADTRIILVDAIHWAGGQGNVVVKWTDARDP